MAIIRAVFSPTDRDSVSPAGAPVRRRPAARRRVRVAAVAALAAAVASAQGDPDWSRSPAVGLGPLLLRSQSPLNVLRLTPTPLPALTVERGEWNIGALVNWDNYFDVDPQGAYIIDAESFGVTMGVAYGLSDRFDVSLALPVSYRGGGILDRFIEDFEGFLGVENAVRRRYPRNQFLILFHGEDGRTYQRTGAASGWGIEDGTATVRYQISEGSETRPALLVGLGLKIPLGREDSLRSTGGVDVLLGASAAQRAGRFNLYATLSGMRYANDGFLGVQLRRFQWSALGAVEFRKSERTSYLLQALVTSPAAVRYRDFAKSTYEVTLGLKRALSRDVLLEASILENLFVFDNSPDVGLHVGLVWRPNRATR